VNRFTHNEQEMVTNMLKDWNVPGRREGVIRSLQSLSHTAQMRPASGISSARRPRG